MCEYPVHEIFFAPQNIAIIASMIREETGLPFGQVTGEALIDYMKPIFEVSPGATLRNPQQILDHVQKLNEKVAKWAAKDAVVNARFNDYHLKRITGALPVIDRPQYPTEYGATRHTPFLLPNYTKFH